MKYFNKFFYLLTVFTYLIITYCQFTLFNQIYMPSPRIQSVSRHVKLLFRLWQTQYLAVSLPPTVQRNDRCTDCSPSMSNKLGHQRCPSNFRSKTFSDEKNQKARMRETLLDRIEDRTTLPRIQSHWCVYTAVSRWSR